MSFHAKVNLNTTIDLFLTPEGIEKYKELAAEEIERLGLDPVKHMRPAPEAGGYVRTSLWDFMNFFGPALEVGAALYVQENTVRIYCDSRASDAFPHRDPKEKRLTFSDLF